MIATCSSCGYKFNPGNIIGGNANSVVMHNVTISCPACGGMADVENGNYELKDGILTLLNSFDRVDLVTLQKLAQRIVDTNGSADQFENSIAESSIKPNPFLGQLIDLSKTENFRYWAKMLLALIGVILGGAAIENSNFNVEVNVNNSYNIESSKAKKTNDSYTQDLERSLRLKRLEKINADKLIREKSKATKKRTR